MNAEELRRAGFSIYSFGDIDSRQTFRNGLNASGCVFDVREFEEEIAHHKLFFLVTKRLDPTLKQRLPKYPKGD